MVSKYGNTATKLFHTYTPSILFVRPTMVLQNERTPLLQNDAIITMDQQQQRQQLIRKKESRIVSGISWMLCIILWTIAITVNIIGGFFVEKIYY
ncbi:uncharacterized protein BX664DRAFT_358245 [Halteromyces radiatus]|uniref:uncharacterized protein n=1 Tax=Halteromyces radiatus TaxID=101107 RepID=UPI00221F7064|nr:uncharacterized protein BX664DRAFT_358245 [Halteromyces radiatus]KAI8093867.1 hypothetical protein BX664DRAFT_358245 [Halteromyces radiatus]